MKMNFFNNRRFKHGSFATIITVGFIALVVLINVIATLLLERFPLSIDLTSDNRFGISQETIDFLKNVDEKIDITVCTEEQTLEQYSDLYKQVVEVIKSYPKYSSNIKVDFIDLVKNPNFAKQHPEETFQMNDVYVQSSLRSKKISVSEMIEASQSQTTGEKRYRSKAEQLMTATVDFVSSKENKKAILLTGLDNVDTSAYVNLLETNNYEVSEINFLTEDINQEADFVIFPQPSADLTSDQAAKLEAYLDNNSQFGKSLIFIASQDKEQGPVLKSFLAEWGMEIGLATVAETDASHAYQNSPFFILNQVADEDFAAQINSQQPVVTVMTRPINVLFTEKDNRTTKVLLNTYDSAVLLPDDADESFDLSAQEKGSYNTIVMGSRLRYDGMTPQTSNVIAVSSEAMFTQEFLVYPGFSNGDAALGLTSLIAPRNQSVKIVPLEFNNDVITINEGQILINRIIFIFVIPIALAVIGLVIWLRRRHL